MKKNNISFFVILLIIISVFALSFLLFYKSQTYDINQPISNYSFTESKNPYLDYLKDFIYPVKLRNFIDNDYINFSQYSNYATGNDVIRQMKFKAYKLLFFSLFSKTRENFDDCPVTDNFKNKFSTNLLYYYNLNASDDCEVNCSLDDKTKEVKIEVYGNFENTEPTYWNTHNFSYTLDADGNIDDITKIDR